ncbi:MAG: hypothetical protein ACRD1T_10975, partial [Acidimicrobiia bacterium]
LGEHGLADHHGSLDDLLIRVPFVGWGPGLIPSGVQQNIHEFVDVWPSLAALLDKKPGVDYLGTRRTSLFESGEVEDETDCAFAEWRRWSDNELARLASRNPSFDFAPFVRDLACARDSRFKLVRSSPGEDRLYDLVADPSEQRDAATEQPEVVRRLGARLEEAQAEWAKWDGERSPLSDEDAREIERRLSDLGYI